MYGIKYESSFNPSFLHELVGFAKVLQKKKTCTRGHTVTGHTRDRIGPMTKPQTENRDFCLSISLPRSNPLHTSFSSNFLGSRTKATENLQGNEIEAKNLLT